MLKRVPVYLPRTVGVALLLAAVSITVQAPPAWASPASQNTPTVTLTPATAVPNQAIAVTGANFTLGGNATVSTITIGGIAIAGDKINFGKSVTIDSGGNFFANLIVPVNSSTLNSTSASIAVTDSSGVNASASLSITAPTISVSPTSSRMGSTVTVTGANFPIDSGNFASDDVPDVILEYEVASDIFQRVATALPNSSGAFSASFKVPLSIAVQDDGNKIRAVMGSSTKEITATHSVLAPAFTLSPASGAPGAWVTLKASNFPAFAPVESLSLGAIAVSPSDAVYTDGAGSLTATFEVPEADGGSHSLLLTVGGLQYAQTFFVVNASATPQPGDYAGPAFAFDVSRALRPLRGNLLRVFHFDNRTKQWSFYDPRPEVAEFNTLTKLVEGQVYWIGVAEDEAPIIQGSIRNFIKGWNLIVW